MNHEWRIDRCGTRRRCYRRSGLYKTYRKYAIQTEVLRGLDLEVHPGEFLSVVGASGSGKSTLLHLLGTLDRPDKGEILLDGRRIDNLPSKGRDQLRNQTFGFIFQFYHLLPELTALENVLMPQMIAQSVLGWLGRRVRYATGPSNCSIASAWVAGSTTGRASCPAARCSAPPSPARSSTGRASCSPTSRPATSTPRPAAKSSASSAT